MIVRNVLLALLLSLTFTFIAAVIYIFYPLVISIITNREGSGIGAANSGLSFLLVIELLLFIIVFAALQRRSKKS